MSRLLFLNFWPSLCLFVDVNYQGISKYKISKIYALLKIKRYVGITMFSLSKYYSYEVTKKIIYSNCVSVW